MLHKLFYYQDSYSLGYKKFEAFPGTQKHFSKTLSSVSNV